NLGAVTLVSGANGSPKAAVAPGNSLVGSSADDAVGSDGVAALKSGSYVVLSPQWTNTDSAPTPAAGAGAATFCSGTVAVVGTVANVSTSLVGLSAGDNVGAYIVELANGNYVVTSPTWSKVGALYAGAATLVDGATGLPHGAVTASNSLVGTHDNDQVGYGGVTALGGGSYVVLSQYWNGVASNAGAAT